MGRRSKLKKDDFDYHLPQELIAQQPLKERDGSRLMVVHRSSNHLEHKQFSDIVDYVKSGDVVVINNSRVIPARLKGRKVGTGGAVELLLLEQTAQNEWRVLAGGKRLNEGLQIELLDRHNEPAAIYGTIISVSEGPVRVVHFDNDVGEILSDIGHTPLPPYIHEPLADPERYQTVYAQPPGSAAAPTAGLHFTPDLLLSLRNKGVFIETVTLHVGLDTFLPFSGSKISDHTIHSEQARLPLETARRINETILAGGRIWAVGTTTVRVLETAALRAAGYSGSLKNMSNPESGIETGESCSWRTVTPFDGPTDLYIYPGFRFRVVDVLLTNFHLPQSSLILLVSAFTDRRRILEAYKAAVDQRYRFYSFGDAMLII